MEGVEDNFGNQLRALKRKCEEERRRKEAEEEEYMRLNPPPSAEECLMAFADQIKQDILEVLRQNPTFSHTRIMLGCQNNACYSGRVEFGVPRSPWDLSLKYRYPHSSQALAVRNEVSIRAVEYLLNALKGVEVVEEPYVVGRDRSFKVMWGEN